MPKRKNRKNIRKFFLKKEDFPPLLSQTNNSSNNSSIIHSNYVQSFDSFVKYRKPQFNNLDDVFNAVSIKRFDNFTQNDLLSDLIDKYIN